MIEQLQSINTERQIGATCFGDASVARYDG